MHSRRFACLLLGIWFAGGAFMQWISTENYRAVDRLLDQPNPAASLQLKALGPMAARQVLRYQVAEQNRFYFETWETLQLMLGSFFFFFLLFGTREDKFSLLLALLMLIAAAVQRFYLTPEVTSFGRVLDFLPADVYDPARRRLPIIQSANDGVELTKLGLGILLAVWLILGRGRRRSRGDVRQELDLIDKANYRHVDR
ncbi:MAG TPA: hypothetical protein VGZ73_18145 [Bryobacteraceae bacterium]|jgi:hypothetical protein|nr:hypothetical protein [Bryobacteraceae bacterium]